MVEERAARRSAGGARGRPPRCVGAAGGLWWSVGETRRCWTVAAGVTGAGEDDESGEVVRAVWSTKRLGERPRS